MIDPKIANLLADQPIQFESWKIRNTWSVFGFNYTSAPKPMLGEINLVRDAVIAFEKTDHFIHYLVADEGIDLSTDIVRPIEHPILILALSTSNSAHSLSELISFLNFYVENNLDIKIGVNSFIVEDLPFIFQLFELFLPADRVVLLNARYKYRVGEVLFRRNNHFNYLKIWNNIPYSKVDNCLTFQDMQYTRHDYLDDPSLIMEMCEKIYKAASAKYPLYERVMLAKVRNPDESMTTPDRAMTFDASAKAQLEMAGIKFLQIQEFANIQHYLATLYGAKVFVTSYGGAACTNRFFLNPNASVVLLGNNQYKWEYEYPSDDGEYCHLRRSHLFPVKRQTVLLYHNDIATEADINRIIRLADAG